MTYQYQVSIITGACGGEGSKSNWVSVVPTGDCALSPCFGGITSASNNQTTNCGIALGWAPGTSSCTGYPNIKYDIYRSTDPSFVPGPSNMISSCVIGSSYIDSAPSYNTVYYYIVRAEDDRTGGSGPCNGGDIDSNLIKKSTAATGPFATIWSDDFEVSMSNWTVSSRWTWSTAQSHSATHSAWSQDNANQACTLLTKTTLLALPAGTSPVLHFWTYYNIESGYDGGIVEGSSNGTTFTKLALTPNYPGNTNGSITCFGAAQPAFSGNGAFTWAQYASDLSAYAGGNFTARFDYATDYLDNYSGWYIDDVKIDYGTTCYTYICDPPGKILNNLRITKSSDSLIFNWTAPSNCCTIPGYGIYRGSLPWTGYNHYSYACDLSSTTYTDTNAPFSYYYLVVVLNDLCEGSYGHSSSGTEIPRGINPCRPYQNTGP